MSKGFWWWDIEGTLVLENIKITDDRYDYPTRRKTQEIVKDPSNKDCSHLIENRKKYVVLNAELTGIVFNWLNLTSAGVGFLTWSDITADEICAVLELCGVKLDNPPIFNYNSQHKGETADQYHKYIKKNRFNYKPHLEATDLDTDDYYWRDTNKANYILFMRSEKKHGKDIPLEEHHLVDDSALARSDASQRAIPFIRALPFSEGVSKDYHKNTYHLIEVAKKSGLHDYALAHEKAVKGDEKAEEVSKEEAEKSKLAEAYLKTEACQVYREMHPEEEAEEDIAPLCKC